LWSVYGRDSGCACFNRMRVYVLPGACPAHVGRGPSSAHHSRPGAATQVDCQPRVVAQLPATTAASQSDQGPYFPHQSLSSLCLHILEMHVI
jgi:hypothetical protein